MAVVDAHVFYWTKDGMRATAPVAHCVGYVQIGEVERLLEDAHRQGYEKGAAEGAEALAFHHL